MLRYSRLMRFTPCCACRAVRAASSCLSLPTPCKPALLLGTLCGDSPHDSPWDLTLSHPPGQCGLHHAALPCCARYDSPSDLAASSSAGSICSRMGSSSRATKGSVTNIVASAMPAWRAAQAVKPNTSSQQFSVAQLEVSKVMQQAGGCRGWSPATACKMRVCKTWTLALR